MGFLLRTFKSIFPAPRYRLRWLDPWPLVAFLTVYGLVLWMLVQPERLGLIRGLFYGGAALLIAIANIFENGWKVWDWRTMLRRAAFPLLVGAVDLFCYWRGIAPGKIVFTQPWRFALLGVMLWIWWMHHNGWHGLNRSRSLQALIVRLLLIGVFVALLAEPRSVRTSDTVSVVYALDISESIHQSMQTEGLKFVAKTVSEKPEGDEAGLVVFGSSAAVELPPRESFPLDENDPEVGIALNARVNRDATNIEQSLSLAAALLPEQTRGRIVLVSDGSQTSGNLKPVLQELQSRGISVDVLPINYSYDKEVWVERVELPQFVKVGEPYEASVVVSSLKPGKGKIVLEEGQGKDKTVIAEIDANYNEGKNRVDIPIYLNAPGYYEYTARLVTEEGEDGRTENNEAKGYIYVEGEGKALIVVDPLREDDRDFERLQQAIKASERDVEVVESFDFPRDPLSLMPYDCVVFANVPQDAFDVVQLDSLRDAIYNQGIGFIMTGGENSYGPGGYHRTVIEEALPVTMDITKKKILPKGALAIILHTCEFPEGNTWAKRITKQAIKVLGSQDEVGAIGYGTGGEYWIFELTPAGEYDALVPKINAASIGDMPAFGPTMQMGYDALVKSDAATKHMIIISDGDPQAAAGSLINDFVKAKISVSTVAIFPHGGQEIGLLRAVANTTGGRYYFPADPSVLPSIFIKEAKTLKRSMIQEKTFTAQAGYPSPVIEGITGLPPLHGFVLTSLKENALTENVLFTIPEDAEADETDPVLAIWRYGLGTTAAFTSSLSNQWARDWVDWEKYTAFVKQLLIRVSRVRQAGHLRMWTYHTGSEGVIMVEDFHPEEMFLDIAAQVNGPNDEELTVPLKQVGPRRYQATFPANEKGMFQVMALGKAGQREDRAHGGFIVSYSPEYLRFTSNYNTLRDIQEQTGGTQLTTKSSAADIYNRRVPKISSQPIFDWFLIALAMLVPLDVAVRRVQIDWQMVLDSLGLGKRGETTKTMGALLARKGEVSSQLKGLKEERPMQTSVSQSPYEVRSMPTRTAAPRPKATQTNEQSVPSAMEQTTTSRLLSLKKKREDETKD